MTLLHLKTWFVCMVLLHACSALLVTKHMGPNRMHRVNDAQLLGATIAEDFISRNGASDPSTVPSVITIPGVGGSQLQAKRTSGDHWYCETTLNKWFLIWLPLSQLLPSVPLFCWKEHFMLQYDAVNNEFLNATGMDVTVTDFGGTSGFEYLDDTNFFTRRETVYFATLVHALVASKAYQRNVNLFGAPYDWRLSPDYLPGYFVALQELIEHAYAVNNVPVVVIAHSMGNLFFKTFLTSMSQSWTDKYVGSYIAVSAPWVGASEGVLSLTSGYNFAIPYLNAADARQVQRAMPSTYFLMPLPKFWGETTFVSTPTANYTANDYQALFNSLGLTDSWTIYGYTQGLFDPYSFPNVNTYCFWGYNVTTNIGAVFEKDDWNSIPDSVTGDGDGTVPIESLNFCEKYWTGLNGNYKFNTTSYQNQEHVDVLSHPPLIQDILNILLGEQTQN